VFVIHLFQTASADLQESYEWYEEQNTGLGERFIRDVNEYLNLISENPYQYAIQFSGKYRFALLRHFPFRIVYRVDEKNTSVCISNISYKPQP